MSKSRGNIIYPRDLLMQGRHWNHIRFFLIYGHYRRKLNFTFTKYAQTCERLDRFRHLVKNLSGQGNTTQKSGVKAKKLVAKLALTFEENMNNDLQVKDAIDTLFTMTSKLVALKNKRKLSVKDSNEATARLEAIDQVLKVIF